MISKGFEYSHASQSLLCDHIFIRVNGFLDYFVVLFVNEHVSML